jgi:hypothetical protein
MLIETQNSSQYRLCQIEQQDFSIFLLSGDLQRRFLLDRRTVAGLQFDPIEIYGTARNL